MISNFKIFILQKAVNATVSSIRKPMIEKFPIPIPPLPIQEEIVKILDSFTELEAELELKLQAELEARRKQYEYYRNKLLTPVEHNGRWYLNGKEVEWKKLGEVAKIFDGTHQTPNYTDPGVPFVSVENIKNIYSTKKFISYDDFNKYKVKPRRGDLFMTRMGDIGTCAVIENDDPLAYYVTLALIRIEQNIITPNYLKYLIESNIGKSELNKRILVNATPIKINLGDIGKINIPIPPLSEQERIVAILDKFDVLVNDLTSGLPAEIEARRKQYEYYRNKLLQFPPFQKR